MKEEKKKMQAQFHREAMVSAAEQLFESQGYDKTLMDEIAVKAGYSKSTVYVYFKSKEEIFQHIVLRGMEALKERFERALVLAEEIREKYFAVCNALAQFRDEYPLRFAGILGNISLDFSNGDTENVLYRIFAAGERLNGVIGQFLQSGIAAGEIKADINVKETVFVLWASLSGIVRIAADKFKYIESELNISKNEFLQGAFGLLFEAIAKKCAPLSKSINYMN